MKTKLLPIHPDKSSPAGAAVRIMMQSSTGGMIHSTLKPHQTTKAVCHSRVNEFWYVLEGHGEIWRKEGELEEVTSLTPGVAIDIDVGTQFQYRNIGTEEFKFICITMPPWSGIYESTYVEGHWEPSE